MAKKNTKKPVKKVTFKPKKGKQEATYKVGIVVVSKSYDYVLLYNNDLLVKAGDITVKSVIDLAKDHFKMDDGDLILDENKYTTFKDNATFYVTAIEMDRVKENKQLKWVSWDEALGLVSSKKALRETFELFKSLKKIPKDKVISMKTPVIEVPKESKESPKEFEPESLEEKSKKKGGNFKKEISNETLKETPLEKEEIIKDTYFTKNIVLIFATLCIAVILIVLYFILSSNNEAIKQGVGVPVA